MIKKWFAIFMIDEVNYKLLRENYYFFLVKRAFVTCIKSVTYYKVLQSP